MMANSSILRMIYIEKQKKIIDELIQIITYNTVYSDNCKLKTK